MKVQYCSDLHLEFVENYKLLKSSPLLPSGDILLLAGDIVPLLAVDKYPDFFDYVSDHFAYTYWVPGNHEYYFSDIGKYKKMLCEKIRDNVFLVNNTAVTHENVKFIFSTLWTQIATRTEWIIKRTLSDFHVIKCGENKFIPEQYNQLHRECLSYLQQEVAADHNKKTVVVTHHVPTHTCYPVRFAGDPMNSAFAVELTDFIESALIDYWIFGHHHCNVPAFTVGKTQLLTNQMGYVKKEENKNFLFDKIIEITQ